MEQAYPRALWPADPSAATVPGGASRIGDRPGLAADTSGHDRRRGLGGNVSVTSRAGGEPAQILVVDDHPGMKRVIADYLEDRNMRAISASGRQEMARLLAVGEPSLVVLDLQLGRDNGFDLLHEIRSRSRIPVIITTGPHSSENDRVVALELGADDCINKPFSLRELLARIRAVLRRRECTGVEPQRDRARGRCRFGGWGLNRHTRCLTDPNGFPVAR
jgi:two-component system OmpR family response regulator